MMNMRRLRLDVLPRKARVGAGANLMKWPGRVLYHVRAYPLGAAGAFILVLIVGMAVFAPLITTRDPLTTDRAVALVPPGASVWFGTDYMGRDLFSRIVFGSQISICVAISATSVGALMGVGVGLVTGYFGGWIDLVTQRVMDVMQAIPLLIMAIVISTAFGASVFHTIVAISIPLVPLVARVMRSETLALRELPFVDAARAAGMTHARILLRHILPNALSPVLVIATAQLGSAILVEAALSYLGVGIPEPYPSWGRMLSDSAAEYLFRAPWVVIFPGLAISSLVFATNLLGDAVRDALDPRRRL